MLMKTLLYFSVFAIIAAASGCTTLADARKAEGEGVRVTYQATYKQAWDASLAALSKLNLAVASENQQQGYILAQRGMSAFSYGENIALFVKKQNEAACTVEVVSKKAMATNIFATDWSQDIHKEISQQLRR